MDVSPSRLYLLFLAQCPAPAGVQETVVEYTTEPLERQGVPPFGRGACQYPGFYSLASWTFWAPAGVRVGLESPLVDFPGRRILLGMLRGWEDARSQELSAFALGEAGLASGCFPTPPSPRPDTPPSSGCKQGRHLPLCS